MTKSEFLSQLKKQLRRLPQEEIDSALSFYEEYIDDFEGGEQAAINQLGSAAKVASQIIANFAIKDTKSQTPSRTFSTIWIVLLAVFASPIALPLAIVLFAVVIVIVTALIVVVVSIGASGLSAALAGVVSFISAFWILFEHIPTALFFMGSGLLAFAIGCALIISTGFITKKCFESITRLVGSIILRRVKS